MNSSLRKFFPNASSARLFVLAAGIALLAPLSVACGDADDPAAFSTGPRGAADGSDDEEDSSDDDWVAPDGITDTEESIGFDANGVEIPDDGDEDTEGTGATEPTEPTEGSSSGGSSSGGSSSGGSSSGGSSSGGSSSGGSSSGGSSSGGSSATACRPGTFRMQHLQASMLHTSSVANRRKAIDNAFDSKVQTISWTEIETDAQVDHIESYKRKGWSTYWPSGKAVVRARNAVPISWRTDTFTLVKGRSWFASVGRAKVSPSRYVTRVWLRHKASGRIVSRVAHHAVSGVDGSGKDPVAWRRASHAKDVAKFKAVMKRDSVPVIGSADFNTTRLKGMIGGGFDYDVPKSGGSHGSRLIDWVVRRDHPEQKFLSAEFVSLAPSDHRGVRTTYDYKPRCP